MRQKNTAKYKLKNKNKKTNKEGQPLETNDQHIGYIKFILLTWLYMVIIKN
jgi:hypothetical protein